MSAKKARIGALRDFRKEEELNWLKPKEYIDFEEMWPQLENAARGADAFLKEHFGLTGEEFLDDLYPNEPLTNFNPNNALGKPRHPWTDEEYRRWRSVRR